VSPVHPDPPEHTRGERRYVAYGLRILSDLPLPELDSRADGEIPQIRIERGPVASGLENPTLQGGLFETSPGKFLLRMEGVARYLVTGGDRIVIDLAPDADPGSVRLFLLGSVFGALLHQRGLLPLHASAIETPKGAVLFAGFSGAGKSALAAAFHVRGYTVIADEICALDGDHVRPAVPRLLLWPDVIEELKLRDGEIRQVRPNVRKFHVPLKKEQPTDSLRVHGLYILNVSSGQRPGRDFEITRSSGVGKLQTLIDFTFRRQFAAGMESDYVNRATVAAQTMAISRLFRSQRQSLRETADLLESDFAR
jgi:hypothetical protein